jgi:two-component system, chemotaxis family, CheB/CheR fusion protein
VNDESDDRDRAVPAATGDAVGRPDPDGNARADGAPPVQGRALTVVGIGASAGGLEAISALLREMPASTGLALVFVQHLSPDHKSTLPELLADVTSIPVEQAADGRTLEADRVYVIPPGVEMSLEDGRLRLAPRPEHDMPFLPIDHFFRSLAR